MVTLYIPTSVKIFNSINSSKSGYFSVKTTEGKDMLYMYFTSRYIGAVITP